MNFNYFFIDRSICLRLNFQLFIYVYSLLTIKQAQLYSSLNVYIGHSCSINSFKSEQFRKVDPEKK